MKTREPSFVFTKYSNANPAKGTVLTIRRPRARASQYLYRGAAGDPEDRKPPSFHRRRRAWRARPRWWRSGAEPAASHRDASSSGGVAAGSDGNSGSRMEELQTESPVRVEAVTRAEMRDTGYERVSDVLSEIPGVVIRSGSTATVGAEQVEGIDSRQVLVLQDGLPVVGARGIRAASSICIARMWASWSAWKWPKARRRPCTGRTPSEA